MIAKFNGWGVQCDWMMVLKGLEFDWLAWLRGSSTQTGLGLHHELHVSTTHNHSINHTQSLEISTEKTFTTFSAINVLDLHVHVILFQLKF